MTETTTAEYYEAHKDDEDEWGPAEQEPTAKKSERRKRTHVVSVRFSPDELKEVGKIAEAAGLLISTYLRRRALDDTPLSTAPCSHSTFYTYTLQDGIFRCGGCGVITGYSALATDSAAR